MTTYVVREIDPEYGTFYWRGRTYPQWTPDLEQALKYTVKQLALRACRNQRNQWPREKDRYSVVEI